MHLLLQDWTTVILYYWAVPHILWKASSWSKMLQPEFWWDLTAEIKFLQFFFNNLYLVFSVVNIVHDNLHNSRVKKQQKQNNINNKQTNKKNRACVKVNVATIWLIMSSFICQPFPTAFYKNIFFHFQLICEMFHHKYIFYHWHPLFVTWSVRLKPVLSNVLLSKVFSQPPEESWPLLVSCMHRTLQMTKVQQKTGSRNHISQNSTENRVNIPP